ncbi:glycosyltransferase family 4 protein [bacterium]|jgi:glycosyltransferase involved in cell wall biosynthesis|nr:glycosyltransferase family 4 protein [bacterium]MBT4250856.1 glycosyltransferase family 4 protein [bacterium]MBT4597569.1 glycosyltransferase family 4 protein [bacterium]MBT6754034.1 glycosyltransferase family 4 protein [bacterium]MBT7038064.1 glycosyltransferase family 4 protein [bacterium]
MKIGFDIRTVGKNRTGDETVTIQLMNNLLEIDKKDEFLLFTDESDQTVLKEIEKKFYRDKKKKKKFEIFSILPSKKAFWTFWSLPKFIKKTTINILHVQYITPLWIPKKTKLVTTIHDISFARYPNFIAKKDLFLLKTFIPLSLRRADKIITVSEFTKQEIIDVYRIDEQKIEVVHNGGATEEFFKKRVETEIIQFKEKNNLPEDFILYIGTLQPRKNIPFLLQNFVKFKQKFAADRKVARMNLVLAGNKSGHNYDKSIDSEMTEIERRFPQIAKQIIFTGFIDGKDLPLYYKSATVVCICSNYEGFGLPAIEAMASETPVLSTNASCMPEICLDAAMFYKQSDPEDFIEKLFQIINDKDCAERLIEKGNRRARQFSWKESAKQTIKVYNQFK